MAQRDEPNLALGNHNVLPKNRPPTIGISPRRTNRITALSTNTVTASPNNKPPSPLTTIPSLVRWLKIAPVIVPKASTAPIVTVEGIISRITATSSTAPEPNRPHGSSQSVEKMYFDSSAPLNLKNSV